jgi:anti-sigma factor RsiW
VSPDLHTLTGAYAVDALPDDEREIFEEHLAVCGSCAQEVAELVATAARLGAASVSAPPAGLREAILSQLPDIRQEPPAGSSSAATVPDTPDESAGTVTGLRTRRPRPWIANLMAPAAAIAAIAVLGLAAVVANLNDRLDQVETSSTQMSGIVAAPDARWIDVQDSDAEMARVVVAPSRGEAMFMVDGMPAPEEGSNYVLWLIDEDGPAPAGAFEVDDRGRASRVITGDLASTDLIGVTVEPADVAPVEPSSDPIMAVDLGTT